MNEWVATQYQHRDDVEKLGLSITITRVRSPFYKGDRWAVRLGGSCLSVTGKWKYEPLPSSRTDYFYRQYRFRTFEAAIEAAKKARANLP